MKVALIQISTTEEQPEKNLKKIIDFTKKAVDKGAKMIMFHEGTLTDYVSDVDKYAQEIPIGSACKEISKLANKLNVYISFGLIEKDGLKRYITQVFLGPNNYLYKYRKTWLYLTKDEATIKRNRNEVDFFDPGEGVKIFNIMGLKASCMICNDGNAKKCLKNMRKLNPELIFYPNNRAHWRPKEYWANIAKECNSPLLITNRVGTSWGRDCVGGCSVYSKKGELLLEANKEGKEEIIIFEISELGL